MVFLQFAVNTGWPLHILILELLKIAYFSSPTNWPLVISWLWWVQIILYKMLMWFRQTMLAGFVCLLFLYGYIFIQLSFPRLELFIAAAHCFPDYLVEPLLLSPPSETRPYANKNKCFPWMRTISDMFMSVIHCRKAMCRCLTKLSYTHYPTISWLLY